VSAGEGVGSALAGIAGWDVPQLRGAVGTLVLVGERLVPWRFRLDAVGRRLGAAEVWSGPAGTAAADALLEVSTVSSGVQAALEESARLLGALVVAAAEAQELAAAASAAEVTPDPGAGSPAPGQHPDGGLGDAAAVRAAILGDEALAAEARALSAALLAGAALHRLGPIEAGQGALGFDELVVRLAPVGPVAFPPVPSGGQPAAAADWWAGLTAVQQRTALAAAPAAVGGLDGLPAWARDQANRLLLDRALRELPAGGDQHRTAAAVAAEIDRQEDAGQLVQLLQFQPAPGLVALGLGDLDTAAAVGVLVPGILTSPDDDLPALVSDAGRVAAAARAAAPGLAVATVAWFGYRTPATVLAAPSSQLAQRGGPPLGRALDGWVAARSAPGAPPPPRTTVVAHSYGTLVASRAAQAPGRLAADAVVLLGSPGTEALSAADLEAPEVYGAWTPADPVSWSGWFGRGPADPWFGDTPLPTELSQGHTEYHDPDRPTLAAVGEVVAGTRRRS
jgi:hypothetical protein